ncbi:MAG: hypothetical protein ACXQS5_06745 [Candidatus Methanospirareceae archaeon]
MKVWKVLRKDVWERCDLCEVESDENCIVLTEEGEALILCTECIEKLEKKFKLVKFNWVVPREDAESDN